MDVPTITKPKEEAQEDYKKYAELIKKRKETYLNDLKKLNYHLAKGRNALDIFEVMKKAPKNNENTPMIAIARADRKVIRFMEGEHGTGAFTQRTSRWDRSQEDVLLPPDTFPVKKWIDAQGGKHESSTGYNDPNKLTAYEAMVPLVPADYLPEGKLSNYYILWEVPEDGWTELSKRRIPPRDPLLLRRISPNMFVVFSAWDLTDLERAVLDGRQEANP